MRVSQSLIGQDVGVSGKNEAAEYFNRGEYLEALRTFVMEKKGQEIDCTLEVLIKRERTAEELADNQSRSKLVKILQSALRIYEEQNQIISEMRNILPREKFTLRLSDMIDRVRQKIDHLKDKIHRLNKT